MTDNSKTSTSTSGAADWPVLRHFIAAESYLAFRMGKRPATAVLYEFVRFGMKQAWACLFGGMMVFLLVATHFYYPRNAFLARYDFLFIAALILQAGFLIFRLETLEETKVIFAYYVVWTVMDIFKTSVGSWYYYPKPCFFHIANVPLFSGFMYACIGSYLCRAWTLFHFEFKAHPPVFWLAGLSIAIYINFFTHHYMHDLCWELFVATVLIFARTQVYFTNWRSRRRIPLLLGLSLVTAFLWLAENVGASTETIWFYHTYYSYPWGYVSEDKFGSWFLLLIISYTLVALIKKPRELSDNAYSR